MAGTSSLIHRLARPRASRINSSHFPSGETAGCSAFSTSAGSPVPGPDPRSGSRTTRELVEASSTQPSPEPETAGWKASAPSVIWANEPRFHEAIEYPLGTMVVKKTFVTGYRGLHADDGVCGPEQPRRIIIKQALQVTQVRPDSGNDKP